MFKQKLLGQVECLLTIKYTDYVKGKHIYLYYEINSILLIKYPRSDGEGGILFYPCSY